MRASGANIGFVPTMGALHRGHETLMQIAVQENQAAVLSIFVNPTQFNVVEDFDKYPRTFDADAEIAKECKIDVVFAPEISSMYPSTASVAVHAGTAAQGMEGQMRPGHFDGVTTVVAKLFNIVLPHRAYFGKKDYQQLAVIRQMVTDLNFSLSIVGVNTVREDDGLALSSRNVRLTDTNRKDAVAISQGLFAAEKLHKSGITDANVLTSSVTNAISSTHSGRIEYVQICDPDSLQPVSDTRHGAVICAAVWYGDVRLIDNIELSSF